MDAKWRTFPWAVLIAFRLTWESDEDKLSSMRVIKPSRLQEYWTEHAKAKSPLEKWLTVARRAVWKSFSAVRQSFRHADEVRVESGRTVVVFNIGGNNYRLICAIHYNAKKVFVLRFMTHAEYSRNQWKETL